LALGEELQALQALLDLQVSLVLKAIPVLDLQEQRAQLVFKVLQVRKVSLVLKVRKGLRELLGSLEHRAIQVLKVLRE
jgi:hypothetical protein